MKLSFQAADIAFTLGSHVVLGAIRTLIFDFSTACGKDFGEHVHDITTLYLLSLSITSSKENAGVA